MDVLTYFQPTAIAPETELIELWAASWKRNGWNPRILGLDDALQQDEEACQQILASTELGRGPLPEGYAHACHLRWLAFAPHGGLVVDYDVLNRSFTPDDLEAMLSSQEDQHVALFLSGDRCPAVTWATSKAIQRLIERILRHANLADSGAFKPSDAKCELSFVCHDQAIFEHYPEVCSIYKGKSPVALYSHDGWETAPLVHFANSVCPIPRHEKVMEAGFEPK